jgi:phosphatidylserine decarboxylase
MTIHREGYKIILTTILTLLVINAGLFLWLGDYPTVRTIVLIASIVFMIAVLQFFRSPEREITQNHIHVLSPADGKVVAIEEVLEEEYFNERMVQISIFMSPLNVHKNFYPISGMVKYFKYHPGKYLVAWHPKSSTENERTTVVIANENNGVLVRQIAGTVARRIVCYAKENMQATQGGELGFIKFGSRVDVFLPIDAEVKVEFHQKVTGGKTVLAEI